MAEAFWNAKVESEVRTGNINFKFTEKNDREAFMDVVDKSQANNPYTHKLLRRVQKTRFLDLYNQ